MSFSFVEKLKNEKREEKSLNATFEFDKKKRTKKKTIQTISYITIIEYLY